MTHSTAAIRPRIEAVIIGASAGGIEAIGEILSGLPITLRYPIIVVLHQAADQKNLLPEIFAERTRLRTLEAEDKDFPVGGAVYFAPPGYHLLMEEDHSFALSTEEPLNFSRPSIDVCFDSAALAYRSCVLGILLSGANSDGVNGLLSIRRAGGCTIAQDPSTARVSTMPQAAIAAGAAEMIMTPAQIAQFLSGLA